MAEGRQRRTKAADRILHLERTSKGRGTHRCCKLEPVATMAQCEAPRTQVSVSTWTQVLSADLEQISVWPLVFHCYWKDSPGKWQQGPCKFRASSHSETVLNQHTSVSQLLGRPRIKSQDKRRQHSTALSETAAGKGPRDLKTLTTTCRKTAQGEAIPSCQAVCHLFLVITMTMLVSFFFFFFF